MKKNRWLLPVILAILIFALGAWNLYREFHKPYVPVDPVELSVWYAADCAAGDSFAALSERFNAEADPKDGVSVRLTAFDSELDLLSAIDTAGGEELPDMVLCCCDLAAYIAEDHRLCDPTVYFDETDAALLNGDEQRLCTVGRQLLCVPLAWEADVMLVNKSIYPATNRPDSFETLCVLANDYYAENREYFFTVADYASLFNSAMAQLGESFDAENPFESENESVRYIYDRLAMAAFKRGFTAMYEDVAGAVMEGKLACAMLSSVDVMNNAECIDLNKAELLLCPKLNEGLSTYARRVTGLSVLDADEKTQKAEAIFIKWLIEPLNNNELTGTSGLVPLYPITDPEQTVELPELCQALMDTLGKMSFVAENGDPDYVLRKTEFDAVVDNVMKNSLS